MTNQQLKAHCEDVIANPQDYPEWLVDMAKVALASLEAVPVAYVHPAYLQAGAIGFDASIGRLAPAQIPLYTAPPLPELKPIELPVMQVDNPIDGFFYRCDEVIEAIRAAGYEVKS